MKKTLGAIGMSLALLTACAPQQKENLTLSGLNPAKFETLVDGNKAVKPPASRALCQAKRAPRAAFPSGCLAAQTKRWAEGISAFTIHSRYLQELQCLL